MLRISLYISVILGVTFLTLRFIGLFLDLTYNDLFLILGLTLLLAVALPLSLLLKSQYQKKVKRILREYESGDPDDPRSEKETHPGTSDQDQGKKDVDYPSFRNQKQGLKWGGGNIHGSTATRGSKRSFLKK